MSATPEREQAEALQMIDALRLELPGEVWGDVKRIVLALVERERELTEQLDTAEVHRDEAMERERNLTRAFAASEARERELTRARDAQEKVLAACARLLGDSMPEWAPLPVREIGCEACGAAEARADAAEERERELTRALEAADWLITCYRDIARGVPVRGLGEASGEYEQAREALAGGVSAAGRGQEELRRQFAAEQPDRNPGGGTAAVAEAERIARAFHEAYERLAPKYGYETRLESAVPWESVPLMNKRLMVAVAGEVLAALTAATALQRSHQEVVPAAPEVTAPHECQRCGSDEWTDVDYSGCSDCREAPEVLPEETRP